MKAKSDHVLWHDGKLTKDDYHRRNGHRSLLFWFTGLSGSGKSTLARAVEEALFRRGVYTYTLDGDNVRHGLNRDLGFGEDDRTENIRRIGEVAKLFVDAGVVTLSAFISPFQNDRDQVRSLLEPGEFHEIFVKCDLATCEGRDPKGLYKKARAGEVREFTGISSPYEEPRHPDLVVDTAAQTLDQSVAQVLEYWDRVNPPAGPRVTGSPITDHELIPAVCALANRAGEAILSVYQGPIAVEAKEDRSPLTEADKAAHQVIVAGLRELDPDTPILSEEGRDIPWGERRSWRRLWVVDPLDGTKEFIKRNGEFTVNIALVEEGVPVVGVVHVPVGHITYWAARGQGAWRQRGGGEPVRIRVRRPDPDRGLTVVQSRSHPSPELEAYLRGIHVAESVSVGSSLKLCTVAEGKADLYPRLGPTMEWDTAAGQAVVECAGGSVTTVGGTALRYNKENLLNPHFVVRGDS